MVNSLWEMRWQEGVAQGERANWCWLWLQTLPDIHPALEAVVGALKAADYSRKEIFQVRLALEEALVNAIKHGHRGDPAKWVDFRYWVTRVAFLAEVKDQGEGFRPEDVPDPLTAENRERDSGRGLFLMRHFMTWVRYTARGTCVTLCKYRARG